MTKAGLQVKFFTSAGKMLWKRTAHLVLSKEGEKKILPWCELMNEWMNELKSLYFNIVHDYSHTVVSDASLGPKMIFLRRSNLIVSFFSLTETETIYKTSILRILH